MPYPGRRTHHLRGIKRQHHRPGYRDRDRVRTRRRRGRVSFSLRGGLNINFIRGRRRRLRRIRTVGRGFGHVFRGVAKLAALYKLLTKKKKAAAATTKGSSAAAKATRLRQARGTPRPNPRPGHGTPKPNPQFFFFPPFGRRNPALQRQLRHLRVRRFAVMTTNFGANILAPVRGLAYRTGATTGLRPAYGTGRRPRRSRYQTGHGGRLPRLRTSRISSRRTGH